MLLRARAVAAGTAAAAVSKKTRLNTSMPEFFDTRYPVVESSLIPDTQIRMSFTQP